MKFILKDVHGSSDHHSSRPKRISCRTYLVEKNFLTSLLLLLGKWAGAWLWLREVWDPPRDKEKSWRSQDGDRSGWAVYFTTVYLSALAENVNNEQHLPLYERSLFFLPNQIVYLYVLGTEWWCFKAKCQSVHPKGLLAWNRVSLSKQVPTRIRRKGGCMNFFSALVFAGRRNLRFTKTESVNKRYNLCLSDEFSLQFLIARSQFVIIFAIDHSFCDFIVRRRPISQQFYIRSSFMAVSWPFSLRSKFI